MTDDLDLDARLRALFADGDFDVPAPAGTDSRILAGARRAQRRGTTLRAVTAAVAVAAVGGGVATLAGGLGDANRTRPARTPAYCPMFAYWNGPDGRAHLYTMYPSPGGTVVDRTTIPSPGTGSTGATSDPTASGDPNVDTTIIVPHLTPSPTGSPLPTDRPMPTTSPGCAWPEGGTWFYAPATPAPWESATAP
jgi:hypothetical protein